MKVFVYICDNFDKRPISEGIVPDIELSERILIFRIITKRKNTMHHQVHTINNPKDLTIQNPNQERNIILQFRQANDIPD